MRNHHTHQTQVWGVETKVRDEHTSTRARYPSSLSFYHAVLMNIAVLGLIRDPVIRMFHFPDANPDRPNVGRADIDQESRSRSSAKNGRLSAPTGAIRPPEILPPTRK